MQKDEVLGSWKVEHETNECELRLELLDGCHIIPKYTIIIDSGFTFTLFVYNWPIPDEHAIYQERARSVRPENIGELLRSIESAQLCGGLPDLTEVKDIALDPVDDARIPGTIIRHSLPKLVTNNEAVFEVSVSFRSVACSLLQENNTNCDKPCKLCLGALNASPVGRSRNLLLSQPKVKHRFRHVEKKNFELRWKLQDWKISSFTNS